ncbi:DUF4344 domain-containing metallopeptidase [Devosia sp. A449]
MRAVFSVPAALICGLGLVCSATAQDLSEADAEAAIAFAMHDASFTMYHEIGHLLVGELGLPVLGKEEDAADALAVIMLLNDDSDDDSYNALVDSADGWYFNAVKSTGSGVEDFSYYDEHSLDIQRAYAMVCMMVGKDPEAFSDTADAYELDQDQRDACAVTYEQANVSWTTLLEPHAVSEAEGAAISISYEDAGDYTEFANALESWQVLERAAALVTSRYVLPGPVTFRATLCGEANAYYSPGDSEITYCYELAADMFGLYVNDILGAGDEGAEGDGESNYFTKDADEAPVRQRAE